MWYYSENPFNYDLNDLDLDHFCLALQRDLHEIATVSAFLVNSILSSAQTTTLYQFDNSRDPMEYIFTKL